MAQEWIDQRWKEYKGKRDQERLVKRWQESAYAARASMFDNLAHQVDADIKHYNDLFVSEPSCKASFDWAPNIGVFTVRANGHTLRIGRDNDTTIIQVESLTSSGNAHFEIAPDEHGDISYRQGEEFLDVEHASKRILSAILC